MKATKEQLETLRKYLSIIDGARESIQEIAEDLQGKFDVKSEKWQEDNEESQSQIDLLAQVCTDLESVSDNVADYLSNWE